MTKEPNLEQGVKEGLPEVDHLGQENSKLKCEE